MRQLVHCSNVHEFERVGLIATEIRIFMEINYTYKNKKAPVKHN